VIDRYFRNAARVKELAAQHHVELVPAIFSIGYSNDLLRHDPNLVEALPVREVPLVVRDGVAVVDDPAAPTLRGGDMSDRKRWSFVDDNVSLEDGTAHLTPSDENARLSQRLTVRPYTQYHVRVRIKSQDFEGVAEIKALAANGHSLQWANLGVQPTQDWTEHHVVFNSLEHSEVSLYLGVWGEHAGELWWDDAVIEEVAFLNLVRRDGAPLVVKQDGRDLVEGEDFDALTDPLMGTQPYNGEFTVYHDPPQLKTSLLDGTKLTADYYHAITIYDGQAMICPSEPRTAELLRDQIRRMHELWGAKRYMMSHDEVRVLGHCAACRERNMTPGQILAANVRECIAIARDVAPEATLYVWNDMFDPHHNAVEGPYYLVNGSLTGSWEGLDENVVIVAWYFEQRENSLRFFSDRGHRYLIAGYYDGPVRQARDWLDTAHDVPGYEGIMYTTWRSDYDDLEAFAKEVDAVE
jgi:hypothetical protein